MGLPGPGWCEEKSQRTGCCFTGEGRLFSEAVVQGPGGKLVPAECGAFCRELRVGSSRFRNLPWWAGSGIRGELGGPEAGRRGLQRPAEKGCSQCRAGDLGGSGEFYKKNQQDWVKTECGL
jgi:hypothetical protein